MADIVLSNFLQAMFDRMGSFAREELGLFLGLRGDIGKLRDTVSIILDVLADAEERQQTNRAVKRWLKQLKEAAYDAADILGECETEALRRKLETEGRVIKKVREFFSTSNPLVFHRLMAPRVKEIRERLDAIAGERSQFDLRERDLPVIETKARKDTVSFIDESSVESRVYGREEDKENVVDLLLNADNDKKVSVIPVVGMGGLGKTTLAQCVYNDARVERHFNLKIWVCVSNDFDVGRLTKAILENATTEECKLKDVDVIQRRFREHISGKKFLLVLDDVWDDDQDKWELLKGFLQAGAMGSKIVVTTRSEKVASVMGTLPWQCLKKVSDDDCWSIFKQRAFRQGRQENPILVDLGKEITKKCGGIPLIAKALGSLMYFKIEESQWQFVIDNEIWNVLEEDDRTLHVLRLSYDDLQPPLKQCFAYCSVFPKDHRMCKEELIQLWMAEGFIQPSQGNRLMEDIGKDYFENLMWRSFFQDVEKDYDGNIVSCKMHDLIHDLARSVSEDVHSIVAEDGKITIPDGCRHLSVEIRGREKVSMTLMPSDRAKKLRTLLLLRARNCTVSHKFVTHLPCLRVLDLSYVRLSKDVLNSISGMKHLRYLRLKVSGVKILSNSLSKLHNLQILRLINGMYLNELPRDMKKMVNLRHLQIEFWGPLTRMPVKMGELRFLQTLPLFIVGEDSGCNIRQLGNLKYLRGELNIQKLENVTNKVNAEEAQLSEKANLKSLGLSWSHSIADAAEMLEGLQPHRNLRCLRVKNYGGERLPHWMGGCSLPNLVELSLSNWRGWKQVQLFGQFRSLKTLSVSGMDPVKCFGSDFYGDGAFPSLEEVTLSRMANLEEWSGHNGREEAVLPRLRSLKVVGCPKLSAVPCFPLLSSLMLDGFEAESLPNCFFQNRLTHLSKLEISNCRNLESMSRELGNVAAALKKLRIYACPKLVSLFPEEMQNYFPFLRNLEIRKCDGLTSLFPEEMQNHSLRLQHLQIWESDGLTSLRLQGLASLTSLSIMFCKNLASFVGGMHPHTALQHLEICGCPELLGSFADGMEHLTSLTSLSINLCAKVTHLPQVLKHATHLQYLNIINIPNLSALPEWIGNLSSLQQLFVHNCPNLVSLPSGFQHLTNLQQLSITHCPNLVSLPYGFQYLTNLQTLSISSCPNLVSLPSGFQHLTNLLNLQIVDCHPELMKRCEKERGEDWHKISHIPDIYIPKFGSERRRRGRMREVKSRCFNALIPTPCIRRRNLNGV